MQNSNHYRHRHPIYLESAFQVLLFCIVINNFCILVRIHNVFLYSFLQVFPLSFIFNAMNIHPFSMLCMVLPKIKNKKMLCRGYFLVFYICAHYFKRNSLISSFSNVSHKFSLHAILKSGHQKERDDLYQEK